MESFIGFKKNNADFFNFWEIYECFIMDMKN